MKTTITIPAFWLYRGLTATELGVAVYLLNIYDEIENKPTDGWFIQMKSGVEKICGIGSRHTSKKIFEALVKKGIIEVQSGYIKGWGTKEATKFRLLGTFNETPVSAENAHQVSAENAHTEQNALQSVSAKNAHQVSAENAHQVSAENAHTDTIKDSTPVSAKNAHTEQNALQSVSAKNAQKYITNNSIINKNTIDITNSNYVDNNIYTETEFGLDESNIRELTSVLKAFKFPLGYSNIEECLSNMEDRKRRDFENIYKELLNVFNYVYSNYYSIQQVAV